MWNNGTLGFLLKTKIISVRLKINPIPNKIEIIFKLLSRYLKFKIETVKGINISNEIIRKM